MIRKELTRLINLENDQKELKRASDTKKSLALLEWADIAEIKKSIHLTSKSLRMYQLWSR